MKISKRNMTGLTDQPQNTPATILRRMMTFHLRKWERHRRSWILSELLMSIRYLLTYPLCNDDLPARATSQYLLERLSRNCTSPNGIIYLILPLMLCLMSMIRLMSLGTCPNDGCCHVRHHHVSLMTFPCVRFHSHFVLDSYIEMSLK